MRATLLVSAACVLALTGSAFAQDDWTEFVSREDGFKITFPGTRRVEEITWTSQMGYRLPARLFMVDRGSEHYSVTVADYRGISSAPDIGRAMCTARSPTRRSSSCSGTANSRE
jgi:hypothetical protein